jgi:putative ABC transport system permease protein
VTLFRLAIRDIGRSTFRSWVIAACAFLIAGLGLATLLITGGAQQSLGLVSDRLGADVIVVPAGSEPSVENALLMGVPTGKWMPVADLEAIRALPGVAAASPQVYLASLSGASCCSVSSMFLVAFDPSSDFTVQPWIDQRLGTGGLALGDGIGGASVSVPEGDEGLTLYGYPLRLISTLAPTGTNLDRSLFITAATARDMASRSATAAVKPLVIPEDGVSAVLVKVAPDSEAQGVAALISDRVPGVSAVAGPRMFATFRSQMSAILNGLLGVLGITLGLSLVFIALVSTMAAHERKREIGVLRALGATRSHVVVSQVLQAAIVTIVGGVAGASVAAAATWLFRDLIIQRLGFPFIYPAPGELVLLSVEGLLVLVAGVALAVAVPAIRSGLQEPSATMRE